MAETIILDPTAVATGRTQLDITAWIAGDGPDWGDAAIEQYLAEASVGQVPVDFRLPNRIVSMPLRLRAVGATSFETIRAQIQQKAALFQREGGWLSRATAIGTVYAEVTSATLKLGGSWYQATRSFDVDAVLTLECIPDFYQAEVDLGDNAETSLSALIFTDTGVKGNFPGRERLVVDEDSGQLQRGLIYGVRSRHYSSSAAARLRYPASELTVVSSTVQEDWTPLYLTDRDSGTAPTGPLLHTGSYRIWIKATLSAAKPSIRFVWALGSLVNPTYNTPATVGSEAAGSFLVDLGEVRLDPVPVGTHQWTGVIQAKGVGATFALEEFWLVPIDEGYGTIRVASSIEPGASSYVAMDSFNQTAGSLTGKTADVGGVWAGAGDTSDFTVDATEHTVGRGALSDADIHTGRYAVSGASTLAAQVVQVDVKTSPVGVPAVGVLARYTDINNWFRAEFFHLSRIKVWKCVAGTETTLASYVIPTQANVWKRIRLAVLADGTWTVFAAPSGGTSLIEITSGQDSVLATGGALASGKPGIYDCNTDASLWIRDYDNFSAWAPVSDAVMYANQSIELRHDGVFRENSGGTAWSPITTNGSLLRLPPAGLEGRTVETFVKASRGDLQAIPDAGVDDISARRFYRPSYLFIPEA